jgi:hypothetical protein
VPSKIVWTFEISHLSKESPTIRALPLVALQFRVTR